jgi:hypothetical protein
MRGHVSGVAVCLFAVGVSALTLLLNPPGRTAEAARSEQKITVEPAKLPAAIRRVIEKAFPGAEILKIEKEVVGEDPGQFDLEIRQKGQTYEVEVSPEAEVIESKLVPSSEHESSRQKEPKRWTSSFGHEDCTFSTTGRNRFFILEPGYRLVLESRTEKVTITVLDQTRSIGGVETRVVEEREEENGELVEVSRNFFAICREHHDVYYFGEEVDDYEDGRVVAHSGAWRADEKDSSPGILMPGTALLGARHYQEISPKAMDRAEILRDDVALTTRAQIFTGCLQVEETSALDPGDRCIKTYAPGVGLIQDEDLLLTSFGKVR